MLKVILLYPTSYFILFYYDIRDFSFVTNNLKLYVITIYLSGRSCNSDLTGKLLPFFAMSLIATQCPTFSKQPWS